MTTLMYIFIALFVAFVIVCLVIIPLIFLAGTEPKRKKFLNNLKSYPDWVQNDVEYLSLKCKDPNYSATYDERFKSSDFICSNGFIKEGYFIYCVNDNHNRYFKQLIISNAVKISECKIFDPIQSTYSISSESTIQTQSKNASVVGRAVAGGLIAGGAGAVVGAISAQNKNMQNNTTTRNVTSYKTYYTPAIFFQCCGIKQEIHLNGFAYDKNFVDKIKSIKAKYS